MTGYVENAFLFDCEGDELVGVISRPDTGSVARVGVLVVVGGPQYRVGSHRQFVLLARTLAADGIACMRFDYRGMGDSGGESRGFEAVNADIASAVDTFLVREPGVERIVLWGLCDGASAGALYVPGDPRVAGLIMLNPWVRTETTQARTYLKHYYRKRLLSRAFWVKLVAGKVDLLRSFGAFSKTAKHALSVDGRNDSGAGQAEPFPGILAKAIEACDRPVLVCLSGRDYVAREFEDAMAAQDTYLALERSKRLVLIRFDDADHTFSSEALRDRVASETLDFVHAMIGAPKAVECNQV